MIYTYSTLEHVVNSTARSPRDICIVHQNMLPTVPPNIFVIYVFYIRTCCQQYRKKSPWHTYCTSKHVANSTAKSSHDIYIYSTSKHVAKCTAKISRDISILHQNMSPTVPPKVPVIYVFYMRTCCQHYRQKFPWYTCSRAERRITNLIILITINREGKISALNGSKQERGKSHSCGKTVRPSVYRCPFWRAIHRLQPLNASQTACILLRHVTGNSSESAVTAADIAFLFLWRFCSGGQA
jgi:hypothetical protein